MVPPHTHRGVRTRTVQTTFLKNWLNCLVICIGPLEQGSLSWTLLRLSDCATLTHGRSSLRSAQRQARLSRARTDDLYRLLRDEAPLRNQLPSRLSALGGRPRASGVGREG